MPTSYEWQPGSYVAYPNDAANLNGMRAISMQANGMNPNGSMMQPNGNEWGNGSQFASYHPATATPTIPASATSQWGQVTSTKPYGASQSWSTSNTSPPVVWPDKWGPNGVPVSHSTSMPQYTIPQTAVAQYAVPQSTVASLPQPFNAPTATSYYGQTQSSMPTNGWPTNPSPSIANTATAWNGQPQPVLVPMQQRPPQWASNNVANPAMIASGGGTMATSNGYGAPYASTPYASTPLAPYPVATASNTTFQGAAVSNPAVRGPSTVPYPGTVTYPSTVPYPGTTTAVGVPNSWYQYGVPAGSSLGRY